MWRFERPVSKIENWLNYAGMFFLTSLMLMVVTEVTSRYVFNHPIPGYIDYMQWMMAALVFLCFAGAYPYGGVYDSSTERWAPLPCD